jgi:flagellar hook-associated protein 1 FlgK
MVDALNTSLSGLLAFQRALSTTSHNIANASTEGYSRQRLTLGTSPPQFFGGQSFGTGVQINGVERIFDGFLAQEVRSGTSGVARLETFQGLSARVGDLLGSQGRGISSGIQAFFESVQAVANDPASIAVRQTLISEAGSLAERMGSIDSRLAELGGEVDQRIAASVDEINALGASIAEINQQIVNAPGAADGNYPPDLLDQRDRLLERLSQQVDVQADQLDGGAVNVYIGQGQALVVNGEVNELSVGNSAYGPSQQAILQGGAEVGREMSGGTLGGLIDFRSQTLESVRNDVGRTAVALADAFNAVHRQGMDLQGDLGGDFFAVGAPEVLPAAGNTGSATVSVTIDDPSALSGDDYRLQFSAGSWTLRNTATGDSVALSGSGTTADPFRADGLSIEINGTPAADDRFAVLPTRTAAGGFERLVDDPERIAAAAPIRAGASLDNLGDGEISAGEVIDVDDPDLLTPVTITFTDPNTYQINGAGSFSYTSGSAIDVNGWRVRIEGSPVAGDEFTVTSNAGGEGDNRNALALAGLREAGLLEGGDRSLLDQADAMITEVGAATAAAETALASESALLASSRQSLESVSGVNLEEEAANMLRYRQAYEASARMIQTADTLFQSLLAAVR